MKQHITSEQKDELSVALQVRLAGAWRYNGQEINILTVRDINIGTMIEFLKWDDMQFYLVPIKGGRYNPDTRGRWGVQDGDYENAGKSFYAETLCDALWEAVKEKIQG